MSSQNPEQKEAGGRGRRHATAPQHTLSVKFPHTHTHSALLHPTRGLGLENHKAPGHLTPVLSERGTKNTFGVSFLPDSAGRLTREHAPKGLSVDRALQTPHFLRKLTLENGKTWVLAPSLLLLEKTLDFYP